MAQWGNLNLSAPMEMKINTVMTSPLTFKVA